MSPHLDNGALVRLLDREASAAEQAQMARHTEACEVCRGRQYALATWTSGVSRALERSDLPRRVFELTQDRRDRWARWPGWPAAAAVVLFVVGSVALAAPARIWVIQRWATLRSALHTPAGPERVRTASGGQAGLQLSTTPVGVVSFTPDSDVLVVRVASRQIEGSLELETSAVPTASATVRGQGEHEAIVVLPNELQIANTAASHATYRVTLPARLKRVVVVINGDRPVSLAPIAPGDSQAIDLKLKGRR